MSRNSRLSRRSVLRGLGGAAIALRWLEAFAPKKAAAGTEQPPKRFIVMFSANGTLPSLWVPNGGETDFKLSPILSPLAEHRDDLVIIQGVDQQGAGGDGHQIGIGGAARRDMRSQPIALGRILAHPPCAEAVERVGEGHHRRCRSGNRLT
jgi:hypothetical protein